MFLFVCLLSRRRARRVSAKQLIFNERGMRGMPPPPLQLSAAWLAVRYLEGLLFSCFHVRLFIMAGVTAPRTDGVFD